MFHRTYFLLQNKLSVNSTFVNRCIMNSPLPLWRSVVTHFTQFYCTWNEWATPDFTQPLQRCTALSPLRVRGWVGRGWLVTRRGVLPNPKRLPITVLTGCRVSNLAQPMLRRTITCNFIITVTFVTVKLFLTSDMVLNFGFFLFLRLNVDIHLMYEAYM